MPRVDDFFDILQEAVQFSATDLKSDFWRVMNQL